MGQILSSDWCALGSCKTHYLQYCIQQFFGGATFSTSVVRRKTVVQQESLGQRCKPSPVGSMGKTLGIFWLFCILNSSKHCSLGSATRNADESLHQKSTLLSVWGFEFEIPNRYTSFKIALDTALIYSKQRGAFIVTMIT